MATAQRIARRPAPSTEHSANAPGPRRVTLRSYSVNPLFWSLTECSHSPCSVSCLERQAQGIATWYREEEGTAGATRLRVVLEQRARRGRQLQALRSASRRVAAAVVELEEEGCRREAGKLREVLVSLDNEAFRRSHHRPTGTAGRGGEAGGPSARLQLVQDALKDAGQHHDVTAAVRFVYRDIVAEQPWQADEVSAFVEEEAARLNRARRRK